MARNAAVVTTTGQVFSDVSEATLVVLQRVYGTDVIVHFASVVVTRGRYPYLPTCMCGQEFRGYAAQHAAQTIADAHIN